ncbi:lysophospholipid acyltransferase family protein [Aquisalimonas sp.]|uniref:lysophospholipid acyltransferase family protein n=1 Tax=unclassified Aquisalimonas TaxID=2644645 RepID=UPI0025C5ABD6|nr:lysophospholipid acyltransferase family protein [Aquisalimonas sp.]
MQRIHLIRALLRATSLLPLPVAHGLGVVAGSVLAAIPGKHRAITDVNLRLCFPEYTDAQRRRLRRASFRELGKQLMETGIIWYADERRLQRLVVNPDALDTMAAHWPEGSGLLLAGPHLGNWELVSLYVNKRFRVNNLYRPPRSEDLEPLMVEARERTGARSLPATGAGIRQLYKALRQGELVGILPDQTPRDSGEFAPFFGVPARTMGLLAQMARKTGAPVLFTFMERLPWGRGFRLHVIPAPDGVHDPDPVAAAAAVNAGVEACVRIAPAQYQWTYRRFRPAPPGQPNPYR